MKTAMDELYEKLFNLSNETFLRGKKSDCDIIDRISSIIKYNFLEIEKKQIIDAFSKGQQWNKSDFNPEASKQYYEELYGNK